MLSNLSLANSKRSLSTTTTRGRAAPLGATVTRDGVNFSVFSRKATAVEILFFDREDDAQPTDVIRIDPITNRTYHYWHVFVPGIRAHLPGENLLAYLIFNAYWEPLEFELPPLDQGGSWRRWIDTYLDSPQDIVPWETAPVVPSRTYRTGPRSIVVLWANGTNIARKHNDRATESHL